MIEVLDDIPMPAQAPQTRHKGKRPATVPKAIRNTIARYREAYRVLYGIKPEVAYDGKFIRPHGHAQGVTQKRLKEMTQQLIWRSK